MARVQPGIVHQKQCQAVGREQFGAAGLTDDPSASFVSHYNEHFKRCFIEYDDSFANGAGQTVVNRSLNDAAGREYADFVAIENGGGDSRASAVLCEVILRSGEKLDCHSEQEFDAFVQNYLGAAAQSSR